MEVVGDWQLFSELNKQEKAFVLAERTLQQPQQQQKIKTTDNKLLVANRWDHQTLSSEGSYKTEQVFSSIPAVGRGSAKLGQVMRTYSLLVCSDAHLIWSNEWWEIVKKRFKAAFNHSEIWETTKSGDRWKTDIKREN